MSTPLVFTGSYELTVDEKGRILIPADVRKELDEERDGKGLMIAPGQNGKPWFYTMNYFRDVIAPRTNDAVLDTDFLDYMTYVTSSAKPILPDKQNRIVLPDDDDYPRDALGRDVVLVGVSNHLQLWRRDEWKQHKAALRQRGPELANRFRNMQANNGLPQRNTAQATRPATD